MSDDNGQPLNDAEAAWQQAVDKLTAAGYLVTRKDRSSGRITAEVPLDWAIRVRVEVTLTECYDGHHRIEIAEGVQDYDWIWPGDRRQVVNVVTKMLGGTAGTPRVPSRGLATK